MGTLFILLIFQVSPATLANHSGERDLSWWWVGGEKTDEAVTYYFFNKFLSLRNCIHHRRLTIN